ncbi:MAG: hypothetical protein DRH37_08230, partial [Deltaproteobacteria bacterium]
MAGQMNVLKRFDEILARAEGWLVTTFVWSMVILMFVQVCLRDLYTHAHFQWANAMMGYMDWSEPFARLLVLWLTFLGASLVTREERHIRIDLFGAFFPKNWLPIREFVLSLVCVLISAILLWVCVVYVRMELGYGETLFSHFPAWIGELIIPAGFALMLFRFILKSIDRGIEIFKG